MKKRLLSAALALAMVLTLLPVSAFAATAPDHTGVQYVERNTESMGITNAPGYYYNANAGVPGAAANWVKLTSGVVIGGNYYTSSVPSDTTTNFTVIGGSVSFTPASTVTSLNVDIQNGGSLNVTDASNLTSVTVNDSKCTGTPTSTVTLTSLGNKCTNLQLKNVKSGSGFTLQGVTAGTATTGVGHTVNLTNVDMQNGTITMGEAGSSTSPYGAQSLTASRVTNMGKITLVSSGSSVHLTDVSGTPAIEYTGFGSASTIWIDGQSSIGAITLNAESDTKKAGQGIPGVKVDGGTVTSVTLGASDVRTGSWTVEVNQQGTVSGAVTVNSGAVCKADIRVNRGHTGDITVYGGTVAITGPSARTGALILSGTTTLNVTGGNVSTGNINANNDASVTLTIPADSTNHFGQVTNYAGGTIEGGTFSALVPVAALRRTGSNALFYQLDKSGEYTYYRKDQLADALSLQNNNDSNALTVVGQTGVPVDVTFKNSQRTWGTLKAVPNTNITLPAKFGSDDVGGWHDGTYTTTAADDWSYNVPAAPTTFLDAMGGASTGKATSLTYVKNASNPNNPNVNVRVSLENGVITASGAVQVTDGTARIPIELTTDAFQADGFTPVKLYVYLLYDETTGKLTFANALPTDNSDFDPGDNYGVTVKAGFAALLMSDNKTEYTLNGTGLKVEPSLLKVDTNTAPNVVDAAWSHIEATVNVSSLRTDAQKQAVINALAGNANGKFNWYNGQQASRAILQAVNAVQAGISNDQIKNWIKQAQQAAWTAKNVGTYTEAKGRGTGYGVGADKVWLVPYLQINVTDYNPDGSMTAALVPSYRIEILYNAADDTSTGGIYKDVFKSRPANYAAHNGAYVAQSGTLGTLTGDVSTAYVKINPKALFPNAPDGTSYYMHQDGTYVYGGDTFRITHAGASTGLGTVVINTAAPLVTRYASNGTTVKGAYDTLQAAVDDSVHQDKIVVAAQYKGSTAITVSGAAREFEITAYGDNAVTSTSGADLVKVTLTEDNNLPGANHAKTYQIQLLRNTTVTTKANITVNSATGGSASVTPNPAKYGEKVTITLSASAGYVPSGVSVTTSGGQSVSVSGSGSSYTFTMPSGSVTVTPSFTRTQQTNPTIVVNNTTTGTATTSAGSSQVAPGTQVTVTTSPAQGQRTMGVNVTGATATRTGANTFTFTVPSGYSTVTVTPRFDVNNGTLFEDVWSTEYYSTPVAWAVGRGITQGDGSVYRFGTGKTCTREDMVTFLWRSQGSPVVNVSNPFWDVQPGSYYYNAVLWAVSKGITKGISANQFGVGRNVIRADAVTFLYRMAGSPNASASGSFYDVPSNQYYAKAVNWAVSKGITNGDGSTVRFNPYGNCLREQIVTFLYRDLV